MASLGTFIHEVRSSTIWQTESYTILIKIKSKIKMKLKININMVKFYNSYIFILNLEKKNI